MKTPIIILVLLISATLTRAESELIPELAELKPYVGKTWKGVFGDGEKGMYDVARWERVLNGHGVKIIHSVGDGGYGGETMTYWNAQTKKVEYYYFTTAGFMTKGVMSPKDGKLVCEEEVLSGGAGGVTKVKAVIERLEGNRMKVSSEYFKEGVWAPGHTITYSEAPDAKVVFK